MSAQQPPTSYLVTDANVVPAFTSVRDTDAARALVLGLADYLASLETEWCGRRVAFKRCVVEWAENESKAAAYPSAVVMEDTEGAMYSQALGGNDEGDELPDAPGWEVLVRRAVKTTLRVEVWCTSPEERMAIGAMLEDAADPVAFMGGFRLVLPHYHGVHATYDLLSAQSTDNQDDAQRRYYLMVVQFSAECVVIRLRRSHPVVQPRITLTTTDASGTEVTG